MNTKTKGDISQATILAEFIKREMYVSVPWGDIAPYDLIIDDRCTLKKIQCKTGWITNSCVRFSSTSVTTKNGRPVHKLYKKEDVDFYAVRCEENKKIYIVPFDDAKSGSCFLRLERPKNNQHHLVKMAEDYEIDKFFPR